MGRDNKSYPEQVPIDEYGEQGFRFADMSHSGSILCLPSGIIAWDIGSASELSIEMLKPIFDEADNIELLYIGMGRDIAPLKAELREALAKENIYVEPLSTGAAISTYNILLDEKRLLAAALIAV